MTERGEARSSWIFGQNIVHLHFSLQGRIQDVPNKGAQGEEVKRPSERMLWGENYVLLLLRRQQLFRWQIPMGRAESHHFSVGFIDNEPKELNYLFQFELPFIITYKALN